MFPPRPTELLHTLLRERIAPGDFVIDATAGNGHDTLFLAETVGATGTVIAIDIQEAAISATRKRLAGANLLERVRLHCASHADLKEIAVGASPSAIVFNLGYLPGGDRSVITRTEGTLAAISESLEILRPGGTLAVLCYPGHSGGDSEAAAVEGFISAATGLRTARYGMLGTERPAPFLLVCAKQHMNHPQGSPMPIRSPRLP
jgi:SAM-dependent methyltransferase